MFAILAFPGFCTISVLVESLVGQAPPLSAFSTIAAHPAILIQLVLIGIFLGALSEELGWLGYALDKFQARWAPLPSALLLGVIWWAWHVPLFFTKGTTQNRWGFASPHFFLFFFWIVALSLLMTWLFNHNGRSTLLAVLVHFVSNFTLGLILPISALGFLFLVVLLVAAAIAVVLSGGLRTPASAPRYPSG